MASRAGGMSARTEFEWPVAGPNPDPLRFATTPFRRALGKAEKRGLAPRFTTDVARTAIPLAFADSTMATLCIDVGEIRTDDGRAVLRQPIHEIELELEAGHVARLFELAHVLAADVPLAFEPASKAERGYALRQPRTPAPLHASDAELSGKANAGDAFAGIIRACLAQIEGNAEGVCGDDDPEWIHQMRIGVRRLRACLSLARRGMATARVEPLRVELRWLAQSLGPARDLDVFATSTLPAVCEAVAQGGNAAPLEPSLAKLTARTTVWRKDARGTAQAAVASPRSRAAGAGGGSVGRRAGRGRAAQPCERAQAVGVCTRFRTAVAQAPAPRTSSRWAPTWPTPRRKPGMRRRLAAKKLRYATEFFAPLFAKKRTRNYRKALGRVAGRTGRLERCRRGGAPCRRIGGTTGACRRGVQRLGRGPRRRAQRRLGERVGQVHENAAVLVARRIPLKEIAQCSSPPKSATEFPRRSSSAKSRSCARRSWPISSSLGANQRGPILLLVSGVEGGGRGETANTLNEWMDPRHIRTFAFGPRTPEETARPMAWRYWRALPPRGKIGIFVNAWYR